MVKSYAVSIAMRSRWRFIRIRSVVRTDRSKSRTLVFPIQQGLQCCCGFRLQPATDRQRQQVSTELPVQGLLRAEAPVHRVQVMPDRARIAPGNRTGQRLRRTHCKRILHARLHQRAQGATSIGRRNARGFHQARRRLNQAHSEIARENGGGVIERQPVLRNAQDRAAERFRERPAPRQGFSATAYAERGPRQQLHSRPCVGYRLQGMERGARSAALRQWTQVRRAKGSASLDDHPRGACGQLAGNRRHGHVGHGNEHTIALVRKLLESSRPRRRADELDGIVRPTTRCDQDLELRSQQPAQRLTDAAGADDSQGCGSSHVRL